MMRKIQPESITDNAFEMIGKDWLLVSACTKEVQPDGEIKTGKVNTMTASWGGLGVLWNKDVATIYLRPTRYTKEIIDKTDSFSISVLPTTFKNALNYCGTHSGRDCDKLREAKLDVNYSADGTPWIKQARLVLICKKIYVQEFDPNCFADELVCKQNYKKNDFHTMYIGEITRVMFDRR
ncbi:MAG: flavin reductase [Treponema sp.]